MKHILNGLSSIEKNNILEQHKGGKKIDTSRFKSLLESKLGNVKPLISEVESKNFCLTKYIDETKPGYKKCMFEGVTPDKFGNYLFINKSTQNHVYGNGENYSNGDKYWFVDSSGKKVYLKLASIVDISGVPKIIKDSSGIDETVKSILEYMVSKQYLNSSDISNHMSIMSTLKNLPIKNKNIAKKGSNGEVIVSMPDDKTTNIKNFIFWPKANLYYYDEKTPNFSFTDQRVIDSTLLTLLQNRK